MVQTTPEAGGCRFCRDRCGEWNLRRRWALEKLGRLKDALTHGGEAAMSKRNVPATAVVLVFALGSFVFAPTLAFAITGGNEHIAGPRTCKPGTTAHRVRGQHGHWVWTCRHRRHSMGY